MSNFPMISLMVRNANIDMYIEESWDEKQRNCKIAPLKHHKFCFKEKFSNDSRE